MKKALIIVSALLIVETGALIYILSGNEGPNEEVIRAEERIKGLESDLTNQKLVTSKATERVVDLKKDLNEARSQKPIIEKHYNEERNRISNLTPDESVRYLAEWLSETPVN